MLFNFCHVWLHNRQVIVTLITANEDEIIVETDEFASPDHFFELVRFDFIIDNEFELHLMEVNMSPNLTPSKERMEVHGLGYEQVIFNVLRCIGLANDQKTR